MKILLLLVHQHILKQHEILYKYLRQTSLPRRTYIVDAMSMGNISAVLYMVRGTQLMVLKDPLFPRGGVLEVSYVFFPLMFMIWKSQHSVIL